jgi:hypothetical protein
VARASANLLKQNAETLQNACRFGLDMATSVMGQSTEQFGRTLGLSGDGVQQATERSARNAQTIPYTGTAAAKVMGGMSREFFQMVQHQVEKNMNHMNDLWSCRTPQDFAAVLSSCNQRKPKRRRGARSGAFLFDGPPDLPCKGGNQF